MKANNMNYLQSSLIWVHIVCNIAFQGTYTEDVFYNKSLEWQEKGKKNVMLFTPFLIISLLLLSHILGVSGRKIDVIPRFLLIVEFSKVL